MTSTQAAAGPDPVCLTDSCHAGVCSPVLVAHLPAAAEAGSTWSSVLGVDESNIYLELQQDDALAVLRVAKCGGNVTLMQSLKQGVEVLLVADAAGAYWSARLQHLGPDDPGIWFASSSDAESQPFVFPDLRRVALALNPTTLFWLGVDDSDGPPRLRSMPRSGGGITQFDVLTSWRGLAADDDSIYWSGSGIWRTPIAGGSSVKLADGWPCERSLVATDHAVLWVECPSMDPGPDPYLASIPKAGGPPAKLVEPFLPMRFVPHHGRVYFSLDGAVQAVSEDGGKPRRILEKSLGGFAVDDYALYWVESGAIWKMGLPD